MKNKKKQIIIAGASLTVVLVLVLVFVFVGSIPEKVPEAENTGAESTVSVSDISVEDPEKTDDTTSDTNQDVTDGKIPDGATVLTPDEKIENVSASEPNGEKPATAEQPVTPIPLPDEGGSSGVVIGGGEQPKPYSCGVEGHHCDGPETHAFILNLELEGCPYCESNKCASFYATDEWGNTCYTPSKCPKYDIKKDSVYYCQDCGKKCGDGKDDTCVQFVNSADCPNCGAWVESRTCHTCK